MTTAPGEKLTPRLKDTIHFTSSEVRHAIESMPTGKSSGDDKRWQKMGEQVDTLTVDPLYVALSRRFTRYKGVRQGNAISPNLYCAVMESVIRKCDWDEYGVNVNGRMLNHLRFADVIVLLTRTPQERMVHQLNEKRKKMGLQLDTKKTKVVRNRFADHSAIWVDDGHT
ncbi:hypothetical protein ANCDUO_02853 [Ancylostoma duodenale]|uniref:Reverse transcriptase domain-containing protein n=1 Tax=Ancylostoma duodenale TaxID=51022 RepID=A0A0C2H5K0_9BILA|nr:hypothetical protein ANCDUO_02853 [Ancylostoma duodenale]